MLEGKHKVSGMFGLLQTIPRLYQIFFVGQVHRASLESYTIFIDYCARRPSAVS